MATEKDSIRKLDERNENSEIFFILKLSIKGSDVQNVAVANITIREWVFDTLPRIEIDLSDNGRFTDQIPLEDNDEIEIEINNFASEEPPIKSTFILQDWEFKNSGPGKSQQTLITLTGLLKTTDMTFPIKRRIFASRNSQEVFETIAGEAGLDFESKVTPKDEMNWIQMESSNHDFLRHVLYRSYVGDNDTPFLYTDRKGKMTYTSLRKELGKEQEIKRFVFNIQSAVLNSQTKNEEETEELLEEEREQEGNIFYFFNWKFKNMAGTFNKTNSYGRSFNYYDLSDDIHREITTDDHPLSMHSLKDKANVETPTIVHSDNYGIQDNSNVHENYHLAFTQNKYLRDNFFSSYLMIYTRPNDNIKLFDLVNIEVPSLLPIETNVDEVHSGRYIVGGIIHNVAKQSIYNTILILFRNGMDVKGYLKNFESKHSSDEIPTAELSDKFIPSGINIIKGTS